MRRVVALVEGKYTLSAFKYSRLTRTFLYSSYRNNHEKSYYNRTNAHSYCYRITNRFIHSDMENNAHTSLESVYHQKIDDTLHSIAEYIEELITTNEIHQGIDVNLADGMLTIDVEDVGQYVINRQSAARQLWLSSPISGPKHFDLQPISNIDGQYHWICNKSHVELGELLSKEISSFFKNDIKFILD